MLPRWPSDFVFFLAGHSIGYASAIPPNFLSLTSFFNSTNLSLFSTLKIQSASWITIISPLAFCINLFITLCFPFLFPILRHLTNLYPLMISLVLSLHPSRPIRNSMFLSNLCSFLKFSNGLLIIFSSLCAAVSILIFIVEIYTLIKHIKLLSHLSSLFFCHLQMTYNHRLLELL